MCTASPKWKNSISPGNDLVWLDDPANRGRFADLLLVRRVLTAKERLLVQVSNDPDRMLWSLWAAKEAAFKSVVRLRPASVFSPQRFEVDPRPGTRTAMVAFDDLTLPVQWTQGKDWVHAWLGEDGSVATAVERLRDGCDQSTEVRALALRLVASLGLGAGQIDGKPPVFRDQAGVEWPVSLSHDGPWLAVAVPRPSR